ncbi:MAG: GNAT family N-acetyltransferase [Dermatophilaceae bacterium]
MALPDTLHTPRLVLSPLEVTHASEMAAVLSGAGLYEYTGGEPPTVDRLEDQYRHQVAGSPRRGESWHNWILRFNGVAIGFLQATVVGETADLAWVVGVPWQRQGFASEASLAVRDWLTERGVVRLTAHIHPEHLASISVATRLGLRATDQLDDDGERVWSS